MRPSLSARGMWDQGESREEDERWLTDVGMVDLCKEPDLRWAHGVLFRQEQLQSEDAICMDVGGYVYGVKRRDERVVMDGQGVHAL